MPTTWAQLHKYFLQAVGDSQVARDEAWVHLSEGYRTVTSDPRVDVPELQAIDDSVTVTATNDFVTVATIDLSVYAISDIFNVTEGFPMYPEPGGMIGRNRYLDTTGKPPTGTVTHWMRDGTKIYVRQTPTVNTILRIRVKQQTPQLSLANANDSPLTPPQYDMPIWLAAAESYYLMHPKTEGEGSATILMSDKFRNAKESKMVVPVSPRVEEDRSRHETFRLRGYSLHSRRRW